MNPPHRHANDRRGFFEHTGIAGQHTPHDDQSAADVCVVGDPHRQIKLPDVAVVVHNFTDNFPVGNDYL